MTMHMTETEQRQSYAAVRARLMGRPVRTIKAAPVLQIETGRKPVDASYHVTLYRAYQAQFQATFSMGGSFTINPTEAYCPYRSEIVFQMDDFPEPRRSMKEIAMEVLKEFPGVSLAEIIGPKRARNIIYPRHMAMYRIWSERKDVSFPMIGKFFNRDHTSSMAAIKKMRALIDKDPGSIAFHERKTGKTMGAAS